jgi:hypothetical protein
MERVGRWERNGGTFWEIHYDSNTFSVRTLYGAFGDPGRYSPIKTFDSGGSAHIYIDKTIKSKERHYERVI